MACSNTPADETTSTTQFSTSAQTSHMEKLTVKFLSIEKVMDALKPLKYMTMEWSIGSYGNYLFATHYEYPYIVRYNITANRIDKIVDLGDIPKGWYYTGSTSADGKKHIAESRELDGSGISDKVLIDFEKETIMPTQQGHYADGTINQFGRQFGRIEKENGKFNFNAADGSVKEIKSLPSYAYSLGECVIIDKNRLGAIIPLKDNIGGLGYYRFVVIDILEDKIVQECAMNEK